MQTISKETHHITRNYTECSLYTCMQCIYIDIAYVGPAIGLIIYIYSTPKKFKTITIVHQYTSLSQILISKYKC